MGKKRQRATQTSKGIHCQKKTRYQKEARREWNLPGGGRMQAQLTAFLQNKNVVLTIPNPNTNETNKRFIKVNANDVWKRPGKQK